MQPTHTLCALSLVDPLPPSLLCRLGRSVAKQHRVILVRDMTRTRSFYASASVWRKQRSFSAALSKNVGFCNARSRTRITTHDTHGAALMYICTATRRGLQKLACGVRRTLFATQQTGARQKKCTDCSPFCLFSWGLTCWILMNQTFGVCCARRSRTSAVEESHPCLYAQR